MGTLQTLPADFFEKEKEKAPDSLPASFFEKAPPPPPIEPYKGPELGRGAALRRGAKGFKELARKPLLPIGQGLTSIKESFIGSQGPVRFDPEENRYILDGDPNEVIYAIPRAPQAKYGLPPPPPMEIKRHQVEAAFNIIVDFGQLSADTIEGLSTPENVAILATLAAAPEVGIPTLITRGVSLYFTKEMTDVATRELREAYDLAKEGKMLAAGRKFSSGVIPAVFAIMAGTHAVKGKLGPREVEKLANEEKWNAYDENFPPTTRLEIEARGKLRAKGEPPPEVVRPEAPPEPVPPTEVRVPTPPKEPSRVEEPPVEKPPPPPEELVAPEAAQQRIVEEVELLQQERIADAQRGSFEIQKHLPKEIAVTGSPEDLSPILGQFFSSPSSAFGRVSKSAGEIVERVIEATENISRDTSSAISEYERVWRPMDEKQQQMTVKLLDNPEVTPENLSIRTDPKVRNAYLATRVLLDNQRVRINEARVVAKLPPIEGITEGYFPHVFQGNWAVTKQAGKDWVPIETGWLQGSQVDAVNAAREYLRQNPGANLKVQLKELNFTPGEATVLSRKGYFRLMKKLSEVNELHILPNGEMVMGGMGRALAQERLKGVARFEGKPTKKAPFGHVKERRTDLSGWLEDPKALEILIRGAERYIQMTQLRPEIAKLRERVNEEAPGARRLQRQLDSYIDTAVLGRTDNITASFNAAWELIGEKMGIRARPGALQRISRRVNEMQSLLKLGFSPVSAFVNLSQTPINTFPVLGAKYTLKGMRLYVEATRAHFRGDPNKYWDIIEELNIPHQASKIEEAGVGAHLRAHLPRTAKEVPGYTVEALTSLGLIPFRTAEQANRSVAALGAYERAIDAKKSHVEALNEARGVVTRTQFQYGPADSPAVLRAAWGRVPFQFKTFMVKEMEFILGLKGKEVPRFAAALMATTGVAGIPAIGVLDASLEALGIDIDGMSLLEYLRVDDPADERSSLLAPLKRAISGGIPALLGVDIVRNVGFQEFFSPAILEMRSLLGPTGNDVKNFSAFIGEELRARVGPLLEGDIKTTEEFLRGQPSRQRGEAARAFASQLSPIGRRAWSLLSELSKGGEIRDPRTGKRIIENLSDTERLLILFGFTPTRVSSLRAIERAWAKKLMEQRDIRAGFVDQLARIRIKSDNLYEAGDKSGADELEERFDYLMDWADRMDISRGLVASVTSRKETLEATALERLEKRTPRYLREEIEKKFPPPPEE